mmetsp:Transcript_13337/g.28962  ORF Transcript_13337/g.28962 Transcript_13337/m.28962 type:complete len:725 (+) Transcript_13337:382-2556(+)|eukprot:CAMPEP_0178517332 /NCGR_PEP_ID=MMETSP0696-20121128/25633_1 /TAXON_ID=265572 /ORGANISM="Extubocellulus spinifer, Strain CCMP396" /LENGTH=724 /DNA_ID=CAMNT_0020147753 /DNA_START=349 /DNA_END=2523 /DNA_ORIENTATION=+
MRSTTRSSSNVGGGPASSSSGNTPRIGRRRGTTTTNTRRRTRTRSGSYGLSSQAIFVAVAVFLFIFSAGIILGARMVLNASSTPGNTPADIDRNADGRIGVDEAAVEIAHLVKDSARAEAALIKERADTLKQKAGKLRQRLRGSGATGDGNVGDGDGNAGEHNGNPTPGDPFYNPHHAIDDYTGGADEGGGNNNGGAAGGRLNDVAEVLDDPSLPAFPYLGPVVESSHNFQSWVPPGGKRFEEYKDGKSPYRITDDLRRQSDDVARSRRLHIKNAMKHAWKGYTQYAFGQDEVHPQSANGHNNWGGMGTTLVDSLDTLWLMDLKEEFWAGRDWVRDNLDHDHVGMVSVFETTIRSLGGLLAAYDWSGDDAFLAKADDLGKRLFKAFDSPSGLPWGQVNLGKACCGRNAQWAGGNAILSEVGTLQVEFRYLARATGKKEYAEKSDHAFAIMNDLMPKDGLMPLYVRNKVPNPSFSNNKISLGAMGDSIYEYMLKMWLQGGKKEAWLREMYDKSMQGVHDKLLQKSNPSGLTYFADLNGGRMDYKMDHLVCFMGGLLALGAVTDPLGFHSDRAQRDMKTAKAVTYTCYQMYARMETGISPEYVNFRGDDFEIANNAPYYILRPETVESFFILHQITGDPIYREWGWEVFQSIERYCRTNIAYGSLKNVRNTNQQPEDRMESFFLAETIKYLYLLQDPDTEVDVLKRHVFNTEAHPLRNFDEFKGVA